jgi:hypothetical protein
LIGDGQCVPFTTWVGSIHRPLKLHQHQRTYVSNNDITKQNLVKPKPAQADRDRTSIPCQEISFAMIGSGSIGKQALWLVTGTLRPGDAGLRSGDSVNEARREGFSTGFREVKWRDNSGFVQQDHTAEWS